MKKAIGEGLMLVVTLLLLLTVRGPVPGQAADRTVTDRVEKPVREAIDIRRETQRNQEQWRHEKQERIALYEGLQQEQTELNGRLEGLMQKKRALQDRIAAKTDQLARIQGISSRINPFLDDVMIRLAQFFANDTPFLKAERQRRMDNLVRLMAEPEVTISEKLRKIMEALMVEAEYGRTIEVYHDTVNIQGQATLVDIFRLGRVALFYQTLDAHTCGFYNVAEGVWQPLPGKYRDAVSAAMDMGAKRRPVEIVSLPVGRLEVQ